MQPKIEYELITSADKIPALAQAIAGAEVVGFDIETASNDPQRDPEGALDPRRGKIRLMQFNVGGKCYVVDLFLTSGSGPLPQAIQDSKAVFIGQSLKFETKWMLFHHKVELRRIFDTYRADVILHNGKLGLKHDLYSVWDRWLGFKPQSKDRQRIDWSGHLDKDAYDYAAEDVLYLLLLRDQIKPALAQNGLNGTALLEFNVVLPEAEVELNGFPIDAEAWTVLAHQNIKEAARLRDELVRELPSPTGQMGLFGYDPKFNIDSPDQILTSLRKLGFKQRIKKEGTQTYETVPLQGTGEIILSEFAAESKEVRKLLEYRGFAQNKKMFGLEFLKHVSPLTGRIHSNYFAFLASGRYSCSPNIAQIPRSKLFRACFRAKNGRILVLSDYAGVEMRIMAELSGDEELIRIFNAGIDVHKATAATMLDKAIETITKDEKQQAKPVNFGIIYGLMPNKLVSYARAGYGVTLTEREARQYHKKFLDKYEGVARWQKRVLRDGQRSHESRSIGGRIRYMSPDAYNEHYNNPDQATGADGLKRAMRLVYDKLKRHNGRAQMVHHVHDEIIVECDDDPEIIAGVKVDLHDGMKEGMSPYIKRVPVLVEPSHGYTWADAK